MKLFDLHGLIDDVYFVETLANKLNDSWVKGPNGRYYFVQIMMDYEQDENGEIVGVEDFRALLRGTGSDRQELRNIEEMQRLDLTFDWPDSGFYNFMDEEGKLQVASVAYDTEYTWKAGLPQKLLLLDTGLYPMHNTDKIAQALNTLSVPNKTLEESQPFVKKLGRCALNPDLAVVGGADNYRLVYGDFSGKVLGPVQNNRVYLSSDMTHFSELLEHWEIPYAFAT